MTMRAWGSSLLLESRSLSSDQLQLCEKREKGANGSPQTANRSLVILNFKHFKIYIKCVYSYVLWSFGGFMLPLSNPAFLSEMSFELTNIRLHRGPGWKALRGWGLPPSAAVLNGYVITGLLFVGSCCVEMRAWLLQSWPLDPASHSVFLTLSLSLSLVFSLSDSQFSSPSLPLCLSVSPTGYIQRNPHADHHFSPW